ncbi:MAG: hypothetical protein PVH08_13210, partial [Syntrophobacterales bacterium]
MQFKVKLEVLTNKSNLLTVLAGSVLVLLLLCSFPLSWAGEEHIKILRIEESINPGTAAFLARGAKQAVEEDAVLLVVELDTPGGLVTSMRTMIKTIMNAPIPVVVFVSPSGAQAASAGVFVVMAADIAAMAPGTNIGAAHPVVAGGKDMDETMDTKVVNDLVAFIKSIATRRG